MDAKVLTKQLDQPFAGCFEIDRVSSDTRRRGRLLGVRIVLAALVTCLLQQTARAEQTIDPLPPKILVLRGIFEVFSLGMNDLNEKIAAHGYDTKVTSWVLALFEASCSDDRPVVVIGHSLGGRMCAWVSRKLNQCGKRVPLIIVVDANLIQSIPSNVDKCLNLYVTNDFGIFHGSPVRAESDATEIVNWDVSQGQPSWQDGGVNHFDIDSTDWVHDIIIEEIERNFPLSAVEASRPNAKYTENDADRNTLAKPRTTFDTPRDAKGLAAGALPFAVGSNEAKSLGVDAEQVTNVPMPRPRRSRAIAWHPTRRPVFEIDESTGEAARTAKKPASVVWRPTRPNPVR